ncbi:acyl-CoA thioesterase-2 [Okibacterium sp. HSC-33S16]|uniref:acyl-CoA thioesterase n=1 Tax=Okibacterium sp. HSC-33S16 TaxID=2910965 RepID=UPI00209DF0A5|nr:acyl-CoA thioesterase II [Okibacterium sp. HSC-33S16]MCP2030620.1 acyl-CoA thioesterase-2 [Okibacterium sp. HSC-33S16]
MNDPVESLLNALNLTDTGARTSEDIFTGQSQWMPGGRVYGGQVLAQAVMAASRTTDEGRIIHSMHGYFLRPGDVNQDITFSVDRIHDGRSFSTRRTQAYQSGVPILSMIASFQDTDDGLDHQTPMPEGYPDPESLPTTAELLGHIDHPAAQSWSHNRPFDIRHIPSPIYLNVTSEHTATNAVWIKSFRALPDDPSLHRAALAYASDYPLLESILRRHGLAWVTPNLKIASLDHAMWWHRPARADEWLLYVQESPSASGGRGLSQGRFYTRDGELVASVAQEGMVRVPTALATEN